MRGDVGDIRHELHVTKPQIPRHKQKTSTGADLEGGGRSGRRPPLLLEQKATN